MPWPAEQDFPSNLDKPLDSSSIHARFTLEEPTSKLHLLATLDHGLNGKWRYILLFQLYALKSLLHRSNPFASGITLRRALLLIRGSYDTPADVASLMRRIRLTWGSPRPAVSPFLRWYYDKDLLASTHALQSGAASLSSILDLPADDDIDKETPEERFNEQLMITVKDQFDKGKPVLRSYSKKRGSRLVTDNQCHGWSRQAASNAFARGLDADNALNNALSKMRPLCDSLTAVRQQLIKSRLLNLIPLEPPERTWCKLPVPVDTNEDAKEIVRLCRSDKDMMRHFIAILSTVGDVIHDR